MRKFLAVVKREYIQRVRTKFFVVATILGPVLMAGFTIVPALMFGIRAGGPTRLAIVDQTGKIYARVAQEINASESFEDESQPAQNQPPNINSSQKERVDQAGKLMRGNFVVEQIRADGRSIDEIKKELDAKVQSRNLDGYVVLPADLLKDGQPEFHARNTADLFTKGHVESSISRAVRSERLVEANID